VAEGMTVKDGFGPCVMEQMMVAGMEESWRHAELK